MIFQGICNPPDEIREATFRITASNRMNLQRLVLPQVRIQRRCPWEFPASEAQRTEAVDGGASGKYSRYYRCGYSAGVAGGEGSWMAGAPFAVCGYTRADCEARGMFTHFGGIEFVPPAISVRTYGDKNWHTSAVAVNQTRYNDFVPMVYGTAWYQPPVVFARNDGNLTRMEVLLGIGEMQGVLKVLVNDVEIPVGVAGTNMTGRAGTTCRRWARARASAIRFHGRQRASGRRSVRQHGVPLGGGAEPAERRDVAAASEGAGAGVEAADLWRRTGVRRAKRSAAIRRGSCWTCCGGWAGARRRSTWRVSRGRRRIATRRSTRWI